jgi:hypothetical protein
LNAGAAVKAGPADKWSVSYDDVPAIGQLEDFAVGDDSLRARLLLPQIELDELQEQWIRRSAALIPLQVLDRLMVTKGGAFTEEDFRDAWTPLRTGLVLEWLPVEIVVPVALAGFDVTDTYELAPGIRLDSMPEGEQRARMPKTVFFEEANHCVLGAATHAVVLEGYKLPGPGRMLLEYGKRSFYPIEKIESAFHALRVGTSIPLGWAQIYIRPIGWAWDYKADLPPIISGSLARRYPVAFDNYGWLQPPQVVSQGDLAVARAALREFEGDDRALRLTARRFGGVALREDDEDAVLDLCKALEAALGDGQRTEMTYKLGMRASAVMTAAGLDRDAPGTILKQVRLLYAWRSALAHGGNEVKARRRYEEAAGAEGDGVRAATNLVRVILRQLVQSPELRDPLALDAWLIGATAADMKEEGTLEHEAL